jgi:hypothetical protein
MKPPADDAATGLPILRSWRRVYLFVIGTFIVWVALLWVLTRMYS